MHDPTAQPDDPLRLPATEAAPVPGTPESAAADAEGSAQSGRGEDVPVTAAAPAHAEEAAAAPDDEAASADAANGALVLDAESADDADGSNHAAPAAEAETAPQGEPGAPAVPANAPIPEMSPAACAARLAALFPALFKGAPKPLKLRIQADIQQRAPGLFTRRTLSAFLHRHTTTTAYLVALSQAKERFDLDGAPAGELADEHREAAVAELARRRALHEERRAAENAARRAAEVQARQAHAAADQARRERSLLLRAFDTSTLTRANFCALKRIDEAELDALLATARQEAAQAAFDHRPPRPADPARPPRPPGDRAPGGERRDARDTRGPRDPRDTNDARGGPGRAVGPRPDGAPRRTPHGRPPR
jgi:sRNA-binding protein